MALGWFVLRDGQQHGPFTAEQLYDHAAQGRLHPDDLVRRSDMPAPRRAGDIDGLFVPYGPDTPPPIGTRFQPDEKGFRPADYGSFTPSDGFLAGIKRLIGAIFGK